MKPAEVMQIVNLVVAADGRVPTEQMYGAWTLVIGHLSFDLAKEAAVEAMRDETIRFVEPKHIVGKVARIREVLEQNRRREFALTEKQVVKGTAAPICREHSLNAVKCLPCSKKAYELSKVLGGFESREYQTQFWQTICWPQ